MDNLFTNIGDNTMNNKLISLGGINKVMIASPFLSKNDYLNMIIDQKIELDLIIRLCSATPVTELRRLLDKKNIKVKYFNDKEFHSKLYIFDNEYIIVGSSNFTYSGLSKNIEINIGINKLDDNFNLLIELFKEYWDNAHDLTIDVVDEFEAILNEHSSKEHLETEKLIEQKIKSIKVRKKRVLSDLHKYRISQSNLGKNKGKLTAEQLKILNQAAIAAMSKPVVCINTMEKFNSLQEAAEIKYGYSRGYGHISEVCKEKRAHYKNLVWRFVEDFNNYDSLKIEEIKLEIRKREERKTTTREKTLFYYNGLIYDSLQELGMICAEKGLISLNSSSRPGQIISALVDQSKKKNVNFIRFSNNGIYEYIFFSDYELVYKDNIITESTPINKSLEDYEQEYLELCNISIGDVTIGELLYSSQNEFFKISELYYKSEAQLKKDFECDCILSKIEVLNFLKINEYKLNTDLLYDFVEKSNKNNYYVHDNIIYKNRNDFFTNYVVKITKENILNELNICL
jgi:hypothetical protein